MIILGINAYHPDSSAAIVVDGKLVATCKEEEFRRIKHFAGFPSESIKHCLKEAGSSIKNVDYIAIPRSPGARIFKKVLYGLKMPDLARQRLRTWRKTFNVKTQLSQILGVNEKEIKAKIVKIEHHRAHLASSFFPSDFDKAFLLSMDALGDFASTMWGIGEGNRIKILGEVLFPHSLGFYYTAITQYLGFLNFGDEYKTTELAPYGEATFRDEFKKILKIKEDRFQLGLDYFLHHKKRIDMNFENGSPKVDLIFSPYLEKRLGKRRMPDEPVEKRHRDIAFCLQERLEEVIFHLLNTFPANNISKLCLSGGVSYNSRVRMKLLDNTHFKNIYIPPAPGDAGLPVGASYYLWSQILKNPR